MQLDFSQKSAYGTSFPTETKAVQGAGWYFSQDQAFDMTVDYLTHRDTASADDTPSPNHSGFYRSPLVLSDGRVVTAHTPETRADANEGDTAHPLSRYDLRLKLIGTDEFRQAYDHVAQEV